MSKKQGVFFSKISVKSEILIWSALELITALYIRLYLNQNLDIPSYFFGAFVGKTLCDIVKYFSRDLKKGKVKGG